MDEVTLQTWELIGKTLYENEVFSTTNTVTEPKPIVIAIKLISAGASVNVFQVLPSGSLITARKRK